MLESHPQLPGTFFRAGSSAYKPQKKRLAARGQLLPYWYTLLNQASKLSLPLFGNLVLSLTRIQKARQCFKEAMIRRTGLEENSLSFIVFCEDCLKNDSAFWGLKITALSCFSIRGMYFL